MTRIEYEGKKFECDLDACKKYSVIKGLASIETNPAAFFKAVSAICGGKDEEYAEKLGDNAEKLIGLCMVAIEKAGELAKN